MSFAANVGEVQTGLSQLADIVAAVRTNFSDPALDQTALVDIATDAFSFVGEAALGPLVAPIAAEALMLIIKYNRSTMAGSLTRIGDARKGSNPNIAPNNEGASV